VVISDEDLVIAGAAVDVCLKVDAAQELDLGYTNSLGTMMKGLVVCWAGNEAELSHWKKQRKKLFAAVAAAVVAVLGSAVTVEGLHTPILHLMKESRCLQNHSSVEPMPLVLLSLLHLLLSWLAVEDPR
jgi:hypothetical protein